MENNNPICEKCERFERYYDPESLTLVEEILEINEDNCGKYLCNNGNCPNEKIIDKLWSIKMMKLKRSKITTTNCNKQL